MQLPPDQVERFYAIWKPLILFVNRRLRVEPALLRAGPDDPWNPQHVYAVRESLWANDPVREAFIAENPAGLSAADLAMVESWRHRVAGSFYVYRHLKKHSLLIGPEDRVYGVLGLASPLAEVVPFTPCYAKAVLLPFEESIIYDSLIVPYNISFGSGIRRGLDRTYKDAKERGAIITSLLPHPASRAEAANEAGEVNARVLEAFQNHEFRAGRSLKTVRRDLDTVAAFADDFLAARPEPRSLREFGKAEFQDYLAHLDSAGLTEARLKQHVIGLGRFLRFLRDTERMDYDQAQALLNFLRRR